MITEQIIEYAKTELLRSLPKRKPGYRGYCAVRTEPKIEPNSKCLCGSGKKYKNCCGG